MMDFKTKKAEKLIDGVTVDGKDIYLNLAAVNSMKAAGLAEKLDETEQFKRVEE